MSGEFRVPGERVAWPIWRVVLVAPPVLGAWLEILSALKPPSPFPALSPSAACPRCSTAGCWECWSRSGGVGRRAPRARGLAARIEPVVCAAAAVYGLLWGGVSMYALDVLTEEPGSAGSPGYQAHLRPMPAAWVPPEPQPA